MKEHDGASIVCGGCKLYKTKDCVKWGYWENVTADYARLCLKAGECISKKERKNDV